MVRPARSSSTTVNACCAGSRLYIEQKIFDKVVEGVSENAKNYKVTEGFDPLCDMGPLVSDEQLDRVLGFIEAGERRAQNSHWRTSYRRPRLFRGSKRRRPEPQAPAKQKSKRKPRANEPKIDLANYLERICGVDLTQVIGLNVLSVLLIVSEIGVDMSKWRNAKAFCSWLGLSPRNKISGGKVLDRRTCKVVNRVATTLRLAAQAVGRTNTCLGIFYRRKKAHLGPAKATTATARKLACILLGFRIRRHEN
jgi:hypothetical protein